MTISFWLGYGGGGTFGINSNTSASRPSKSTATQNFSIGSISFTGYPDYLQSYSISTITNTPIQLGFFDTPYIDDIVINSNPRPTLTGVSIGACDASNATINMQDRNVYSVNERND